MSVPQPTAEIGRQIEANVQLPRGRVRAKRAIEAALRKIRAAVEAIEVTIAEWSDEDE